jgi:hypothetical protein
MEDINLSESDQQPQAEEKEETELAPPSIPYDTHLDDAQDQNISIPEEPQPVYEPKLDISTNPFNTPEPLREPLKSPRYFITTPEMECAKCHTPVTTSFLKALGKTYHPACFACVYCGVAVTEFVFHDDKMYPIVPYI